MTINTCPKCGSTQFKPLAETAAIGTAVPASLAPALLCNCGLLWDPSDLEGDRYAFLRQVYIEQEAAERQKDAAERARRAGLRF